jgi:hypothetical protein
LAIVHARSQDQAQRAAAAVIHAYTVADTGPEPLPLLQWHTPSGVPA